MVCKSVPKGQATARSKRQRGLNFGPGGRPGDSGVDAFPAIRDFLPKQYTLSNGLQFLT